MTPYPDLNFIEVSLCREQHCQIPVYLVLQMNAIFEEPAFAIGYRNMQMFEHEKFPLHETVM